MKAAETAQFAPAARVAGRFVEARLAATALADYPGPLPADLEHAYAVQEAAISLWPDTIVGWKVGRILPPHEEQFHEIRLLGPIFSRAVLRPQSPEARVDFPVFVGGFAAVEAEYVFEIGSDAPPRQTNWTLGEAEALAGKLHLGIETAGSPLATINALGPTAVISDFGNNAGLILAGEIQNWRGRDLNALSCEAFVNDVSVGRGSAGSLPGGPIEALRFTAEQCAKRGRPLRAGMFVSTGAATGIHELKAGDTARVEFAGIGTIRCKAVPFVG
ncbi:MAG TPA: fumarylacetoacetate hydrolase family protein [Rhizomicrobium sp.]|nr:fumarylacetoacetate hydrolase family protein [Rhizomicrobium sp.]